MPTIKSLSKNSPLVLVRVLLHLSSFILNSNKRVKIVKSWATFVDFCIISKQFLSSQLYVSIKPTKTVNLVYLSL